MTRIYVKWHGDGVRRILLDALADGLEDVTEAGLEEANRTVPIEEGTLARSGFAEVDRSGSPIGQVAYDTPYAVRQHEDPTFRHDPGRRHHWLRETIRERSSDFTEHIATVVRRRTG